MHHEAEEDSTQFFLVPDHGHPPLKFLLIHALQEGSRKSEDRSLSFSSSSHGGMLNFQSEHEEHYVSVSNIEIKISGLSSLSSKSNLSGTSR